MLEILALWHLTKKVGQMVEEKGRKSGWYKALTVFLWFGGEIFGGIVGALLLGDGIGLYLLALAGAASGAATAYLIAKNMTPAPVTPPALPVPVPPPVPEA